MLTVDNYIPIINMFDKTMKKYGKKYCFPAQKTILKNLALYGQVNMSIRTLNRRLRILEDEKFIKRKRRIKKDQIRGYMFKSTLYKLTKRAYKLLYLAVARIKGFAVRKDKKVDDRKVAHGIISGGSPWMTKERPMKEDEAKEEVRKIKEKLGV
jgi:DNA-binding HxlR family transcriptional regulator